LTHYPPDWLQFNPFLEIWAESAAATGARRWNVENKKAAVIDRRYRKRLVLPQ
jgi:hypothetical protein